MGKRCVDFASIASGLTAGVCFLFFTVLTLQIALDLREVQRNYADALNFGRGGPIRVIYGLIVTRGSGINFGSAFA